MTDPTISRRLFLGATVASGAALLRSPQPASIWSARGLLEGAPGIVTSERLRPVLPGGVQTGDVLHDRAILWGRVDRPAQCLVEWSTSEKFTNVRRVKGGVTNAASAFTSHLDVTGLPPGQTIHYRMQYESADSPGAFSEPVIGSLRTPQRPDARGNVRPVRIAWSGDMVGQGWGIDEARGGLRIYDALRRAEPDVFVHSGDNIYADQPLLAEVKLDDGTIWKNVVTEAKSKVAETLDEFRGCFAYNMLDPHAQKFGSSVPLITQWDDHEVVDNWFHDLVLQNDTRFTEKRVRVLAERAKQAVFEFLPIRRHAVERDRIYRSFSYGPLVEIFVVDLRSYRGANSGNKQTELNAASSILGPDQFKWLEQGLKNSRATWKVVACDMPIGLIVPDRMRNGERNYEAIANADNGVPLGRELEIAQLLRSLKAGNVRNVVWVTADVHYAAAHHYAPDRAAFTEFNPFWELVAGPMHSGTFGPNQLDGTFGPEVRFASPAPKPNRPPSDNMQFYGTLDVDPRTRALTAGLWDVTGKRLWSIEMPDETAR
ncbi:MAG TPA: alkaline phosphatase [Gemmatimonas aurantiaca]|uniref:Alkaline phosphatase n=2 Tax=Gemmatimonas aurantiaca TaxID=173480 RepID=A0A3D4VAB4_9BACT|nr:alkaline phosphatase D family protein [Gemmatimonas aurantiaca]BAH40216.1 putative alkaline phosphatase [Gemmatimonas aurantiaca T-27]HCT57774.1 alkaline phosphatase [Gemmatimonas aurantiaca]